MENKFQIYVNVDAKGEILTAQTGEKLTPAEEWDYYFLKEVEIAEDIYDYKVIIDNMKPQLILKSAV